MSDEFKGLTRLREEVLRGTLNRRDVLKRGAVLGLSAPIIAGLLAACGDDDEGDDTADPTNTTGTGGSEATAAPDEGEGDATATEGTEEGEDEGDATATEGSGSEEPAGERGGGGHLRLLYWQAPVIMNPHLANGTKDFHASRVCLEPLVDFDADTNPILVLAEEWPSLDNGLLAEDGMSVTWKLRQGVKWHDGEDFDADDVIFTYEYITDEATATTTIGRYLTIESIDKVDDYTVTLNFTQPNPAWYDPFSGENGLILPEHVFRDHMGQESRNAPANLAPIGTGPFMVTEFRPGDVILYEIFMDYWDPGKPHIDTIELKGGGDAAGAARAVCQSDEADWAWNLQIEPAILAEIESGGLGEITVLPGGGTERIMIQFADPREEVNGAFAEPGSEHPIWSDLRARQALALSIQRDVIAEQLYGKGGVAASNQYDEPAKFTNPDITWEFDLEQAQALLDEMGFTGGDILYQTSINTVRQKTQEIVKQDLEKLGFSVEIKSVDSAVYFSTDQGSPDTSGKFWADLEMHTNGPTVYPATWFERYRGDDIAQQSNGWSGSNAFRYSNPEFDKMHDQVRIEIDEDVQVQLFQDMMELVTVTDVVEVPVVNRTSLAAKSNRIQGYVGSPWSSNPVYELKNWTMSED
ncbi:MAG TPA: peptide ABC transporter substrate-binding protein [Thermomicrobiales bacterium]|nr:peptide ABC transporter substrate-binding protein [Thermomicrobiales bacterium]